MRFSPRLVLRITAVIAFTSIALDIYFVALHHGSLLAFLRMCAFSAFLAFYVGF